MSAWDRDFAALPDDPGSADGGLVQLYRVSDPPHAKEAVVFVHGLGAHFLSGWGDDSNPGAFVRRLASDLPSAAIWVSSYPSAISGYLRYEDVTFSQVTERWSDLVETLLFDSYQTIAIVGHCLGGFIAAAALRHWIAQGVCGSAYATSLPRLVFVQMDAPHDLPESGPSEWLSGLLQTLGLPEERFREIARHWRTLGVHEGTERDPFSAYAVVSRKESWVTPLGPAAGLCESRVCRVPIPHVDLIRAPETKPFPPYDFVREKLRAELEQ